MSDYYDDGPIWPKPLRVQPSWTPWRILVTATVTVAVTLAVLAVIAWTGLRVLWERTVQSARS